MNLTLLRLGAAAFLADMALYLIMTGVPYRALELGAGAVILGLLPIGRGLPYSFATLWAGARLPTGDRLRPARYTVAAAALAAVAFAFVPGIGWIFALLGILGLALAFYWPALQATLADLSRTGAAGHLGWFNVAWSAGKALGFAVGGALLAGFGFSVLFTVSAIALVGVIALIAVPVRPGPQPLAVIVEPGDIPAARRSPSRARAFRLAGWTGNAISYGVATLLNLHYPHWLRQIGLGEAVLGGYLGLITASQTLTFVCLLRFSGWRYRAGPLLWLQLPLVGVLLLLPFLRTPATILATAPAVGVSLGMTYFASLFYSVQDPHTRGRHAGFHEAILGIGSMLIPVLGGWVAAASGRLEAPYLVGAVIGGIGLGVQGLCLRVVRRE